MNRVLEIEEVISDLLDVDEVSILSYPQWNDVAEDVLRKLRHVRSHCLESSRASLLTPPSSEGSVHSDLFSSTSTSADFSPQSSPYESAAQAFDRQIYSRTIQIVEATQREGPIEMSMISLANYAYSAMVEDAENVDESAKLALWWNQFLERAEPTRPMNERGEMYDYRMTALERLFQLDPTSRKTTSADLLKISTRNYKLASIHLRAFHSKTLRKLEKLIYWLDETRPYFEGYPEFSEAEAIAVEAIKTSLRDQKRFETDNGTNKIKDIDYVMCCDLLTELSQRINSDDDRLSQTPNRKIFLDENNDSGYSTLPRSDTEEDIVLRL